MKTIISLKEENIIFTDFVQHKAGEIVRLL